MLLAEKKRWKVWCPNKTVAPEMEAAIKMRLLLGHEKTEQAKPVLFKEWAKIYLDLETVKALHSYQDRVEIMEKQLVPFFGAKALTHIMPQDVGAYRGQRKKRDGAPASTQTVNNDHIVLKHCLNVAIRRSMLQHNPASRVPLPDPQNERNRILTEEEWATLYHKAKPHLQPLLLLPIRRGNAWERSSG